MSQQQTPVGLRYQQLTLELTRGDRVIYPAKLSKLELPNGIDTTQCESLTDLRLSGLMAT